MTTYACIERRVTRILGHPHSGWSAADLDDDNALEIEFRFEIKDDGRKNFVLLPAHHQRNGDVSRRSPWLVR